jgi:capsule biosynthesis phosphatase
MNYILLCGGIGNRCGGYSLPKPLNYINGKHMIEYIIENIPSNNIYIIYNVFLDTYNFREIIINKFKTRTIHFAQVDYLTRGAIETAYIGIKQFNIPNSENIVFIDNDNIHSLTELTKQNTDFIGYSIDTTDKTSFSFITIEGPNIVKIEEKVKISDNYCCGIYGFKNKNSFLQDALYIIKSNNKTKNEFYFSQLYKYKIEQKQNIAPILIKKTTHIGSVTEIMTNNTILHKKQLRVCFDLDNTLVTYPTIPNDYSSVKPITNTINMLRQLKNEGHEIIIYTARRMLTHGGNVGKVIKDIAITTINTLEQFGIPYDELIFGKPIADIYIDDRAINPYINNISWFGLFVNNNGFIPNKMANNKYNTITLKDGIITKVGPERFMKGELYFYQNIPQSVVSFFPKMINYNKINDNVQIMTEYISGIPLFFLYKNQLITEKIIDDLFNILHRFHCDKNTPILITDEKIKQNYIDKLANRFNPIDYPFEDAEQVLAGIISDLNSHYDAKLAGVIHGDFWFSNILLLYNDEYKCIDMKGIVYDTLTTNGDIYYDYGKLYQSILGYDLVLNNCELNKEYIQIIKQYFIQKCQENGLNIHYLTAVTKSLIFGTMHFFDETQTNKRDVWNFIKQIK